jgi:hypothetical protein
MTDSRGNGRHVDDHPLAARCHAGHYRAREQEGRGEVHRHHFCPVLRRHFRDMQRRAGDAAIIHQQEDVACFLCQRRDLRRITQVAGHPFRAAFLGPRRTVASGQVGKHHSPTRIAQRAHHHQADSGRRRGDQRAAHAQPAISCGRNSTRPGSAMISSTRAISATTKGRMPR